MIEFSEEERRKLLETNGNCTIHKDQSADYICENCKVVLCFICRSKHLKNSKGHKVFNYKETEMMLIDEFLEETEKVTENNARHLIEAEKTLEEIKDSLKNVISNSESEVNKAVASFKEKYLRKDRSISKENEYKKSLQEVPLKIASLMEERKYFELYLYCLEVKKDKSAGNFEVEDVNDKIPYEILYEKLNQIGNTLINDYNNANNEFAKKVCKMEFQSTEKQSVELVKSKAIRTTFARAGTKFGKEKEKEIEIEIEKPLSRAKQLMAKSTNKKEKHNLIQCEENEVFMCTGNYTEDELISFMQKMSIDKYKMIYIDSWLHVGDEIVQAVAEIVRKNKNISIIYISNIVIIND